MSVNKKFKYIKVYKILKKVSGNQNIVEKAVQTFVDRYILRGRRSE